MTVKHEQVDNEEIRKVFLYLARIFEDDVKKNLHTKEIKTEIDGLYAVKITVKKDVFTLDEVDFLFSLIRSDYVKRRLKVKIIFYINNNDEGVVELTIVPKQRLISYFVKRLKYY